MELENAPRSTSEKYPQTEETLVLFPASSIRVKWNSSAFMNRSLVSQIPSFLIFSTSPSFIVT